MANLFRERGSAGKWPLILCAVTEKFGAQRTRPPEPDLQGPGAYLDFFAKTSHFAIFPRKGRRALSAASGAGGKMKAWGWICGQVRTGVSDPQRFRRDSVGAIGVIFA